MLGASKFKTWFKARLMAALRHYFRREFQDLQQADEQLAKDNPALLRRIQDLELALRGIKVGAVVDPGGGSWITLGYRLGDQAFVNFYDFGGANIGALRDMIDRYEKAGMAVLVKSPFDRTPKRHRKA